MATDGAGNLYVADYNNHTIRKVVLSTGAVTTLAGSVGLPGGTDGTGAAARFNGPVGVATDGAGNLYVSEYYNYTIRKVVLSTGEVTTLAGTAGLPGSANGKGSVARFYGPYGMAVDGGALYVADSGNHTIRKVVLSTGDVSTLAGTAGTVGAMNGKGSAAQFYYPSGVAVDGAGNLYVADRNNHTIRKVVLMGLSMGDVSTLAGSVMPGSADGKGTAAQFNQPYSVVVDGAGSLYVADYNNHTIRKVVLSTGDVSTLAGSAQTPGSANGTGTAARFYWPLGVAVDGAGSLYVADYNNHTIRKVVLSTGEVTTLAGSASLSGSVDGPAAAVRFAAPYGVAADGTDRLYIADSSNHTIRKVVLSTGEVTTLAGKARMPGNTDGTGAAARFNVPYGVAVDGAGSLYVADTANHTIRKVVLSTGEVTTLAGSASLSGSVDGTGAAARFSKPIGVAVDGTGNLYVADTDNCTIRKVVLGTGEVMTLAGSAKMPGSTDGTGAAARFANPGGVAVDGTTGNLYVADTDNHAIRKVALSTGAVTTLAGSLGLSGSADGTGAAARFAKPVGVAVDGTSNLYVTDSNNHTIRKIALANAVVTTVVGIAGQGGVKPGPLPGRLNSPVGVVGLPAGEIFIVTNSENALLKAH